MRGISRSVSRKSVPPLSRSGPIGAVRFAFRLPVYVYRFGFGVLFGHRFLLLVHRGRKSGLRREAVLEVIRHDPTTRESEVLSGWGEKADWYRNILANLALEVRTAGERYVPDQRFLAPDENHAVISEYAWHHPLVFRLLVKAFGFGYPLKGIEDERRKYAESLRLVAFRPSEGTNERGSLSGSTNVT